MVALSFQKQFGPPILSGVKRHTLRNPRKRDPRPGDTLQLYTGMRTKFCRLLGTATCLGIVELRLSFVEEIVEYASGATVYQGKEQLDTFAVSDGFASWAEMAAFWRKHHPETLGFWEGNKVFWGDTFKASAPV